MARNDYIAQRDAIRREFFLAGMELEGQRTVVRAIQEREETYREAFLHNPESDWWQEALDRGLREIFGDRLEPFEKRYPNQKKWDYGKAMKK